jgi:hypothetical protein
MKPSAKPLKGMTVSSNFGSFETLTATNLQLESINIAGLFEDGVFQNVVIKDSQIFNTVIGAEGPNVGYFSDLRTNQNVKFISNIFGSYVEWDPSTAIFNINNSTLRVNECSYLGNLEICENFIRATNLDGSINFFPNGTGTIYAYGPMYISTSNGSYYSEFTSGGSTVLTRDNIIFMSSAGSSSISTYDGQTFTTTNGDIELKTNTTRNSSISSIVTTSGNTIYSTYGYHNLKPGDVVTVSSAGNFNGSYTVGTLYTDQKFTLLPNVTSASTITTGSYSKIPNTNIILNTESYVKIPTDTELTFGVTSNAISGNTGSLLITSNGDTIFSVPTSKSILIPQTTKIQFSGTYNTNGSYISNGNYINYDSSAINIAATNTILLTGSLTQINSTNTKIADPVVTIADYTTSTSDGKDRGIEFRYYDVSSGSMKLGWFGYKVASNKFTLIPDATNVNETIYGDAGTLDVGDISTKNISISSGGSLNLNCGDIINVKNISGCSGTINVNATAFLNITGGSRISLVSNGDIYVPNNIPITFGTAGSAIIEETSGNIRITGSKNVRILTQSNGSVSIPIGTYVSFDGTSVGSQRISSNTSGNLTVTTNKDLYLTTPGGNTVFNPNNGGYATSSSLQFGNSSELLYGSTSGITIISNSSSGSLNGIVSSNVNISSSIGNIVLRTYTGDINLSTTSGNVRILPTRRLVFDTSSTSNSILYDLTNLVINGNNSNAVDVKNASTINLGASSNVNITNGTQLNFSGDRSRYIVADTSSNLFIANTLASGTVTITSASTIINNQNGFLNAINSQTNVSTSTLNIIGTTGSVTNLNTENVRVRDPILTLANYALSSNDSKDRGVEYNYLLTTSGSSKTGWFGWKNTTSRFTYYSDAINTGEIVTGTIGNAEFDSMYLKNTIAFSNGGQIDMSCGTISNLRTIIGCFGVVNVIGTSGINLSSSNIMLESNGKVQIPYNIPLSFGTTNNSISADSNGTMTITALGGAGTLVLNSNIQINGTTENVYSTVTNLQDPIFSLGGVTGPVVNDSKDRGIEFKWNVSSGTSGSRTGFFGYKNNLGRFVFIRSGTNVDEVYTGSYGDVQFGNGYFTNLDLANGTISNVNTISSGKLDIITTGGNMNISSSNILIPYDSKLAFGTTSNAISAGTNGNLTIGTTEDITFVTPTNGNGSVTIQNNTPLYFGSDGNDYITRNTSNNLQIVNSVGSIEMYPQTSTGSVMIPKNTFLGFGSTENSIVSNGQELLLNGYNGISINTTNFTISGNVNIIGTISAAVNTDFDINRYILPLGTSQVLDILDVSNYSTAGNLKVTTDGMHNLIVGDAVTLKNTNSKPNVDGAYTITQVIHNNEFIVATTGGSLTLSGIDAGTVTSNLTTYQGKDVGIQVNYWTTSGNASITSGTLGYKTGFFGFKDSTKRWTYYSNATITNNVVTGDLSDIEVNKVFASRLSGFVLEGGVSAGSYNVAGSNFQISGGTINGTPIGVNTAQTGRFTNLSNTVSASFSGVTLASSLAYTFERYTLSSGGLQTRNPSTSYVVSLFSVSGPNYTSSSGTMPSSSASIADGTFKILVCSSVGVGSSHTIFFGADKLITPNPLNSSAKATRITFKRQGQSAQLVFDAQANNSQGSWILLSNGVYVS